VSEAKVIPPGGGELVGDAPERRVEILSDHDSLHATWSRYGPHREGADLHVHRHHTDLFYVLEGELTIRLGVEDEGVSVPAGKLVRVPPLVVHGFRNASDADVSYLNMHAPGAGFAGFMRAMRDGRELGYDQHPPPSDGGRPTSEAVVGAEELNADWPGGRATTLAGVDAISVTDVGCDSDDQLPPPHQDRRLVSLYVMEGEIELTPGDRGLRAASGSWLQLPPGTPHAIAAAGTEPARYLDIRTPG
jgi:quercetin dioxygenase-like cupin family protein